MAKLLFPSCFSCYHHDTDRRANKRLDSCYCEKNKGEYGYVAKTTIINNPSEGDECRDYVSMKRGLVLEEERRIRNKDW